MFMIKNSKTCGGRIRAKGFRTEDEAKSYAVNHLLTWQSLADYRNESGHYDIATTMRRCGLEIMEENQ